MKKQKNNTVFNQLLDEITPVEQHRTDNRMRMATKIDNALKAKGWKNADLARAMDKHKSVITLWLSGVHNFKIDTLSDIEEVLDVKLLNVIKDKSRVVNYFMHIEQNTASLEANSNFSEMSQESFSPTVSESDEGYKLSKNSKILA